MTLHVCKDVFIHFGYDVCMISNVRSREHVRISPNGLEVLGRFANGADESAWLEALENVSAGDVTEETFGENGLHTNPSFIDSNKIVKSNHVTGSQLLELLKRKHILINNEEDYLKFFTPRLSILDKSKMGNFHEKVGDLLVKNRISSKWRWWHDQKFSSDGREITNPFYKRGQANLLSDYFKNNFDLKQAQMLDFGCGNGYFSLKIAQQGAKVIGIDTNKELIDIASKNGNESTKYFHAQNNNSTVSFLSEYVQKFDFIFMQDVLSIILQNDPTNNEIQKEAYDLLEKVFSTLKPGGYFLCTEPNPIFWLAVRLGNQKRPIAVISEYRNKKFDPTPNYPKVLNHLSEYNLGLVKIEHSLCDGEEENDIYNNEFAIWDLMVFKKFS